MATHVLMRMVQIADAWRAREVSGYADAVGGNIVTTKIPKYRARNVSIAEAALAVEISGSNGTEQLRNG